MSAVGALLLDVVCAVMGLAALLLLASPAILYGAVLFKGMKVLDDYVEASVATAMEQDAQRERDIQQMLELHPELRNLVKGKYHRGSAEEQYRQDDGEVPEPGAWEDGAEVSGGPPYIVYEENGAHCVAYLGDEMYALITTALSRGR
jgi:hypothetical protein